MKKTAIGLLTLAIALLATGCQEEDFTEQKKNGGHNGVLKGVFSVSDTKKVHFSKGNLIATIDATGTPTAWKFAANQYDYCNDGNWTIGTATGDVDYFGWSTNATAYGINTSKNASDYSGSFKDWGTAIDDKGTWRTLSAEEWEYLFNDRIVNGGTKEGYSYQRAYLDRKKTNAIYGIILYPDNYTAQITEEFYAIEQWPELEKAGCVFLPAAGGRYGDDHNGYIGWRGYYWSSSTSSDSSFKASHLFFHGDRVSPSYYTSRYLGFSVRLVTEIK